MMRQSVQTVLPESTGNNTLSLRDSVCRDLFQLFSSPHSPLPILLVSGMPEWQGHNQSDKLLQSGIAASYVPRFYFMSHVLRHCRSI